MNFTEKWPQRMRWGIVLLWVAAAAAIGLGLTRLSPSRADSPDLNLLSEIKPQQTRRGFIGLPLAATISLQNILTTTANITLTFALPNGTPVGEPICDSLLPESIRIYTRQGDPIPLANIESNEPVFAVGFELSESGNLAYLGLEWKEIQPQPSPSGCADFLPLVRKAFQGRNTRIEIMNRSAMPKTVLLTFRGQPSGVATTPFPQSIPANGLLPFGPVAMTTIVGIDDLFTGSVIVSAEPLTEPVSVSMAVHYYSELGLRGAYRAGNQDDISATLVAPVLFKSSDLQTSSLCVQNVLTSTQTVFVNYSDGSYDTEEIEGGNSNCFYQGHEQHEAGWRGGAVITGTNGPLFAVVDVRAYDGDGPVGLWSYSVPGQEMIGPVVALPLLLNNFDGWTSEIHLYNFNESPSTITPRYIAYPSDFVYCAEPFTIPGYSVHSISQSELPPLLNRSMAYFSATQPVAAAVSATSNKPLGDTDRHFGYGAAYPDVSISFPDTCGTIHESFLPMIFKEAP